MTKLETLCLSCGLCCDGSLFDNVRLGPNDDAADLKRRGLPVRRSRAKKPVTYFRQPCRALGADCACGVYQNRPRQCRSFECQVFKEVAAGRVEIESALRTVKQARRKAEKVRRLLRDAGERDETLSLTKRFRRVQRRLVSGQVDAATAEVYGDLGLAMHQFDLLAHRTFHTLAEDA
ncbi:YkgJ family cysteine cluster protein [Pelagicoccus sp. SDUM812003]|uniref:YkgJ family cysteine cluster protein n=1 Tax=Pelagicoccus sp. SDUM812003 TaxID=3041267 RepID=UPI00280D03AB|nr:YkgJ family cysteine cluster protein [Pelagicoccus sp. SDUM812003]MDQ8204896.1 YkgJ family cysteine cluster protein [Pelagicoccus sp. SDUM812003]